MVEITEMNVEPRNEIIGKVENDRSYKHDSGVSSVEDSSDSNTTRSQSSGFDSSGSKYSDGSWIKVENEVVDPVSFNPPCFQSSDLVPKSKIWDISSIENVGLTPKSSKGMIEKFFPVWFN